MPRKKDTLVVITPSRIAGLKNREGKDYATLPIMLERGKQVVIRKGVVSMTHDTWVDGPAYIKIWKWDDGGIDVDIDELDPIQI